jgi:hypothetical protein
VCVEIQRERLSSLSPFTVAEESDQLVVGDVTAVVEADPSPSPVVQSVKRLDIGDDAADAENDNDDQTVVVVARQSGEASGMHIYSFWMCGFCLLRGTAKECRTYQRGF